MTSQTQIKDKLATIQRVFMYEDITNLNTDKEYIQKYYKANKLAYSLFHTYSDKMYMGISRDGVYKDEDLLEAARLVEMYCKKLSATKVLELATGRGATSAYLANRHSKIEFFGIELSQGQLDFSQKKAKKLLNYHPTLGDYHDLSTYEDSSIDIVFVIEALCYSNQKELVLAEVKRVLKPGGVFIILDGYITSDRMAMSEENLLACIITEKGMAVNEFEDYPSFLEKAKDLSFTIESSENVSMYIMPTLRRFEKLAVTFFKRPWLAKILTKLFSSEFTYNAAAGLLMPDLIQLDLARYYITVLKK